MPSDKHLPYKLERRLVMISTPTKARYGKGSRDYDIYPLTAAYGQPALPPIANYRIFETGWAPHHWEVDFAPQKTAHWVDIPVPIANNALPAFKKYFTKQTFYTNKAYGIEKGFRPKIPKDPYIPDVNVKIRPQDPPVPTGPLVVLRRTPTRRQSLPPPYQEKPTTTGDRK